MLSKLKRFFVSYAGDLVIVAGSIAVTVGVCLLHIPAGVITGGVLTITLGVIMCRGGNDA